MSTPVHIGLASSSILKATATQNAATSVFGHATVHTSAQARSGVNEQPIGTGDMVRGVIGRISTAEFPSPCDLIVGIESGLVAEDGQYVDKACVRVYDTRTMATFTMYTDGVVVPRRFVNWDVLAGSETWGQAVARQHSTVNAKNPHIFLGHDRAASIEIALCTLFTKIKP